MNCLLQGDVGSGKTIVSILASSIAVESNFQVAVMAPTEILARQHLKSFKKEFDPLKITCALLTGGMARKERDKIIESLNNGKIDLVIGTHALIQKDVKFKKLGLVIIDEQHRFGVNQRRKLVEKGNNPHFLAMTATPIPRTLAITFYGDMDICIIDEMPKNRKPVITKVIDENRLKRVYDFMAKEVVLGRQCMIVYPLVEETEKSDLIAATEMYEELSKNEFSNLEVGLIHGKMEKTEKDLDKTRKLLAKSEVARSDLKGWNDNISREKLEIQGRLVQKEEALKDSNEKILDLQDEIDKSQAAEASLRVNLRKQEQKLEEERAK